MVAKLKCIGGCIILVSLFCILNTWAASQGAEWYSPPLPNYVDTGENFFAEFFRFCTKIIDLCDFCWKIEMMKNLIKKISVVFDISTKNYYFS